MFDKVIIYNYFKDLSHGLPAVKPCSLKTPSGSGSRMGSNSHIPAQITQTSAVANAGLAPRVLTLLCLGYDISSSV